MQLCRAAELRCYRTCFGTCFGTQAMLQVYHMFTPEAIHGQSTHRTRRSVPCSSALYMLCAGLVLTGDVVNDRGAAEASRVWL